MDIANVLVSQILIMFFFMFVGVVLYKSKLIDEEGSKQLGSILLYFVIPTIIVKSLWVGYSYSILIVLGKSLLVSLTLMMLSLGVSKFFFNSDPIFEFSSGFSNAGFIGLPLVQATIGDEGVLYIATTISILNVLQWTYGMFVLTKNKENISFNKIIKSPVVIAFVVAVLLFLLDVPQTPIFKDFLGKSTALNTPLAMITIGVYLAQIEILSLFKDIALYKISLIRLVVIPLLSILTIIFIFRSMIEKEIVISILIALSTPTGANVALLAKKHDLEHVNAVKIICFTTLVSIITIPSITSLAIHLI